MKKEPREHLLQLIDDLKLPIIPEDARKHMKGLKEIEVKRLIDLFEEVKSFHQEVEIVTKMTSPKRYIEIQEKYHQNTLDLGQKHIDKLENIQAQEDEKADAVEATATRELEAVILDSEKDLTDSEKEYKQIYDEFVTAVQKGNSNPSG